MAGPLDAAPAPLPAWVARTNQEGVSACSHARSAVEAVTAVVAASDETAATGGLRMVAEQTEMQTHLQVRSSRCLPRTTR
jgi:uncharacterized Zn finger protein